MSKDSKPAAPPQAPPQPTPPPALHPPPRRVPRMQDASKIERLPDSEAESG